MLIAPVDAPVVPISCACDQSLKAWMPLTAMALAGTGELTGGAVGAATAMVTLALQVAPPLPDASTVTVCAPAAAVT